MSNTSFINQPAATSGSGSATPPPIVMPPAATPFVLSSIRKRKVKFTVQLTIQELMSVPYVNGVLFCKVRLCNGGNHVSFSSKKEVSNSSVIWANDAPIQFDVKTVQLYTNASLMSVSQSSAALANPSTPAAAMSSSSLSTPSTPTSSGMLNSIFSATSHHGINLLKGSTPSPSSSSSMVVVGYEPCYCRISVRKEARGGKSYQKLGFVDYNLSDFILRHQQEQAKTATVAPGPLASSSTSAIATQTTTNDTGEFCVNRILKEYESKKNQQRSDNSFLKIKIKIIDSTLVASTSVNTLTSSLSSSNVPSSATASRASNDAIDVPAVVTPPILPSSRHLSLLPSSDQPADIDKPAASSEADQSTNQTKPSSHSRNSSLSTTNSSLGYAPTGSSAVTNTSSPSVLLLANNGNVSAVLAATVGHNRSCSNGSIKSNISFDYMIKNRNKKFIEELQSTSSSSMNQSINAPPIAATTVAAPPQTGQPQFSYSSSSTASTTSSQSSSVLSNSNPVSTTTVVAPVVPVASNVNKSTKVVESPNLHIIETRIDVNEVISQIENELANRVASMASTTNQ